MLQLEKNTKLEFSENHELINNDEAIFTILSSKKKKDDEDNDEDDFYNKEEEEENPFDKEPTEKDIIDGDIPLINPEDDLLDDEDEIPY